MVSEFGELESLEKDSLYLCRVWGSGADWSLSLICAPQFTLFIRAGNREASGDREQCTLSIHQLSSAQTCRRVRLSVTPWTAARQASPSITRSQSPPKPMSIKSVMPSSHLILCRPRLLLPPIFPSIRVFSNESALHTRWPYGRSLLICR